MEFDGLVEWQCMACGHEWNGELDDDECPRCCSDDVALIGDAEEEKGA